MIMRRGWSSLALTRMRVVVAVERRWQQQGGEEAVGDGCCIDGRDTRDSEVVVVRYVVGECR
jgi:hypothetical protein